MTDVLLQYRAARFYLAHARRHGSSEAVATWHRRVTELEAAIGAAVDGHFQSARGSPESAFTWEGRP